MRAELVRSAVLEIYEQVRREGARADQAMARVIRREKQLRSVERRAVADAVYGLLRLQGRVDNLLGRALATKGQALTSLATPTQHLLRYAGYLVVSGEQSAESAANLAGPEVRAHAWTLELLAAPAKLAPTGDDPLSSLASETSLPRWLAALWSAQLGADETRALAAAINQRAPLTIRTNTLKADRAALEGKLADEDARVAATRWSDLALTFTSRTNVFALKAFKAGLFEVQDEGSQLIAEACAARPGQLVVDACAGAGGKTLALAAQMQNKGKLVACDRDGRRLLELKTRARRAGVHNWEARTVAEGANGLARISDLVGKADVVLIDAPCSGLGALRRNPDARWRLDEAEADLFPPRQKEILERYATLVRPGGRLVYATCSINQRENEEVRAHFLAGHSEFEAIDPDELLGRERIAGLMSAALIPPEGPKSGFKPAVENGAEPRAERSGASSNDLATQSGGRKPSAEKRLDVQLLPQRHGTDGFYIAGLRRKG